jgi:hypothetical protein
MKPAWRWILAALAAGLLAFGCASPDVNPKSPRSHTGYVDLYANITNALSWDVQRFDTRTKDFGPVYFDLDPLEGRILRLAFAPGTYRLRVGFLNGIVRDPGVVEVEVRDGEITPIEVKLSKAGVSSVRTKDTSVGGTTFGRYGRRTKIGSYEGASYRVTAVAAPPVPYQPKDLMPYARY